MKTYRQSVLQCEQSASNGILNCFSRQHAAHTEYIADGL